MRLLQSVPCVCLKRAHNDLLGDAVTLLTLYLNSQHKTVTAASARTCDLAAVCLFQSISNTRLLQTHLGQLGARLLHTDIPGYGTTSTLEAWAAIRNFARPQGTANTPQLIARGHRTTRTLAVQLWALGWANMRCTCVRRGWMNAVDVPADTRCRGTCSDPISRHG